jgi:hypothetical protein
VSIVLLIFAALLKEAFIAYITSPIQAGIASTQAALGEEWIFRIVIAVVAVLLILVAIGLDRVEASAKKFMVGTTSFDILRGYKS